MSELTKIETPTEQSNRILEYCMKATKPLGINDAEFQIKKTQTIEPIKQEAKPDDWMQKMEKAAGFIAAEAKSHLTKSDNWVDALTEQFYKGDTNFKDISHIQSFPLSTERNTAVLTGSKGVGNSKTLLETV
jgi:hypothetical protein